MPQHWRSLARLPGRHRDARVARGHPPGGERARDGGRTRGAPSSRDARIARECAHGGAPRGGGREQASFRGQHVSWGVIREKA